MSKSEFEDISIPKWKLVTGALNKLGSDKAYRVFSTRTEFVTVEAASATDAVLKSGITKVYMVRIGAKEDMSMLDRSMLQAMEIELPPATA